MLPSLLLVLTLCAPAQETAPPSEVEGAAPRESVEEEVRRYVLGQPIGPGSVADLALPEEFVGRVVDRVVRSSFEERVGRVVADAPEEDERDATAFGAASDSALPRGAGAAAATDDDSPAGAWLGAGYAALALGIATWFALRAKRGTA